ncbi:hypothetical protein X975_07747, partial [Stegodyphus mimosarum]
MTNFFLSFFLPFLAISKSLRTRHLFPKSVDQAIIHPTPIYYL